jgi:hypothetical protein
MNRSKMLLLGVCLVALSVLLWSQTGRSGAQQGRQGIPGYLDARTGAFRAVPHHSIDADALAPEAAVVYTGKFVYHFTITLGSTIPTGDVIQCAASADTTDTARETFLHEQGASQATVSGSTATCTVTIPYSWTLGSPTTDTVALYYSIGEYNPTAPAAAYDDRYSNHDVNGSLPMPANGNTTNISISATI